LWVVLKTKTKKIWTRVQIFNVSVYLDLR
jgi:hypothetical protein